MKDYSDKWTEAELKKLERRIAEVFEEARKDVAQETKEYFKRLYPRLLKEKAAYERGAYTEEEFMNWWNAQIKRGEHWKTLEKSMAERVADAREQANRYTNEALPVIYAQNYNYAAYTAELYGARAAADVQMVSAFNLMDERTYKRLLRDNPNSLPWAANPKGAEVAWNKKRINNFLLLGMSQGKSVGKIADLFQYGHYVDRISDNIQTVALMSRASAIRAARTAVTGAQNAGRQMSYEDAERMGIPMEKEWMSFIDSRTRDSHIMLNGIRVKTHEKFPNGLMFPGDRRGRGEEVYNCRCTMTSVLPISKDDLLSDYTPKTYMEWMQIKEDYPASEDKGFAVYAVNQKLIHGKSVEESYKDWMEYARDEHRNKKQRRRR